MINHLLITLIFTLPNLSFASTIKSQSVSISVKESTTVGPLPLCLKDAKLMEWIQIPGTALSSVPPSVVSSGAPSSKITAWCGATLRTKGSIYIIGMAGGHADYAGNEVNALTLNTDAPRWVEKAPPSPRSQLLDQSQFYLDLRPGATHTYYASQFINATDRFVVLASPGMLDPSLPAPPPGWAYANTDKYTPSLNWVTGIWEAPTAFPKFPSDGDFTAALVAKHPVTEDIYYSRNYSDGWYKWTRTTNTWSKLSNVSRGPWYAGASIDPKRNRMLIVGGYGNSQPPEVRNLDGSSISVNFTGLGASALTLGSYPGVIFDELNDRYIVLANGSSKVELLAVHAQTWEVSRPTLLGTAPFNRMNGIQNSVQYVPELRGLVFANSYEGNVYFMRLSP
jgi:hypothetical protein